MKSFLASVVLVSVIGCAPEVDDPEVGESTAAIEPGFCSGVCRDNSSCDMECLTSPAHEWSTCWDYGRCFELADPDHDGVLTFDDNCTYAYNPNQANCDGDNKARPRPESGGRAGGRRGLPGQLHPLSPATA